MTAIKARKCFVPRSPSEWVAKVFLTCDNMLAVQFQHGQKVKKILPHGPGAYLGHGGVPSVCCLYPGTQGDLAERLYHLAEAWAYGGEWVHTFLYKKFGYRLVSPPSLCGGCNTSCSLSASPATPTVGQSVTISCTITNTDGSPSKGDAPQGTVTFSIDGASLGTVTLPDNDPDSQNYQTVSITWTAASGTHTVEAVYTPSVSDFASTNCSTSITVSGGGGGVSTTCCPNNALPTTLYLTIANVSGCACLAGTYTLTYSQTSPGWFGTLAGVCGVSSTNQDLELLCNGTMWGLTIQTTGGSCFAGMIPTVDCATPQWSLSNAGISLPCCTGTVNITVTA